MLLELNFGIWLLLVSYSIYDNLFLICFREKLILKVKVNLFKIKSFFCREKVCEATSRFQFWHSFPYPLQPCKRCCLDRLVGHSLFRVWLWLAMKSQQNFVSCTVRQQSCGYHGFGRIQQHSFPWWRHLFHPKLWRSKYQWNLQLRRRTGKSGLHPWKFFHNVHICSRLIHQSPFSCNSDKQGKKDSSILLPHEKRYWWSR